MAVTASAAAVRHGSARGDTCRAPVGPEPDAALAWRADADLRTMVMQVAAAGLEGDGPRLVLDLEGAAEQRIGARLLSILACERLTGHFQFGVRSGAIRVPDGIHQAANGLHTRAVLRTLLLERALVDIVQALGAAGIDHRVLKGPALARTVYEQPHVRTFVDVDVAVPTGSFEHAIAVLTAAGCRRQRPELRRGFDGRFAKTVTFVTAEGCEVDLHRTLVVGPYGQMMHAQDLFTAQRDIRVAGVAMKGLGPEQQFLNVCYHAVLGDVPPRPATLRDVAQALLHDDIDPAAVHELAARWRGKAVLARALDDTWARLGLTTPHPLLSWATGRRPALFDAALLSSYTDRSHTNVRKYLMSAAVIPGTRNKLAYLAAVFNPARGSNEERLAGAIGRIRHHTTGRTGRNVPSHRGRRKGVDRGHQ